MPSAWPSASELMTARPSTLPFDAPIARALGLMRRHGFHEIPVLRKSRMIGMITFESIARRASWTLNEKVEHLLILPPLVTPTTRLPELAEELLATGLRAAPVVGPRGELLGIVSRTDLVRALVVVPEATVTRVEEIARAPDLIVHENDPCRPLIGQVRLLEEHPLPVLDRKERLVGAVGIADLGSLLGRPIAGGKRDARAGRTALEIKVGSIMHSPAVTVPVGTSAAAAALRMTEEKVSSVFVVEEGRAPRTVGQAELLQLVIGKGRTGGPRGRVEDVYVEITGLRGSGDPGLLAEIDHLVASGLRRIAQHVRPTLLSLHFAPHATHRTSDLTLEARLHSDDGIFYASHTGWNLLAGVSDLLDELDEQTRRVREARRRRGRADRAAVTEEESPVDDPELERRIRTATGEDDGEAP
jgi:CBS domain-containing protein